jgi:hypothetical protein
MRKIREKEEEEMKLNKVLVLCVSSFILSMLIGIRACFSQSMSNYELEQEVESLKEKIKGAGLPGGLSFSGALEVEAGFEHGYGDEKTGNITLATVEVGIEAEVCDWVIANVILLWEEDDTPQVEVDEGTISLGNTERSPLYLTAGKFAMPFGAYETTMISDPLTLELGEAPQSAVQVGLERPSGFSGSVYAFNGDIDEVGEDDKINCFGANIGYGLEVGNIGLEIGAGWINNIADSDGLGAWIDDNDFTLKEYVGGFTGHVIVTVAPFTLMGEYVAALDDIEFTNSHKQEAPSAYALELAYTFELMGKEYTLGVAYQGTDNCGGILPETRLLASFGVSLWENVGVALEYAQDKDYKVSDGGSGDEADIVTVQLAIEF